MSVIAFRDHELDQQQFTFRRKSRLQHVEPQVFSVLSYLIDHRDRVVPKEEFLDEIWGDRYVSESALTSRLKAARQAVGDNGRTQSVIRTVRGRGYQFVADAEAIVPAASTPTQMQRRSQKIRFCTTDEGIRLAHAEAGSGPPLVKTSNWLSHIDFDWESPVWRHWMTDLSEGRRYIRYDERGAGLSDWDVADISLDAWVEDLRTVVDALGLETFPVLAISQGGAIAIRFADRYPGRITKLILYGAYPQGGQVRAVTPEEIERSRVMVDMARHGWGQDEPSFRQVFSSQFMPSGSREDWVAFNELQRVAASPENAARFLLVSGSMYVTEEAAKLNIPTLILHARDDRRVPFSQTRLLASLINGSELVPLYSDNHLLRADEPARQVFLAKVRAFLDGAAPPDSGR